MRYLVVWAVNNEWQVIDTRDNCKVISKSKNLAEMQAERDWRNKSASQMEVVSL